jgi:dienelactone hydrolase
MPRSARTLRLALAALLAGPLLAAPAAAQEAPPPHPPGIIGVPGGTGPSPAIAAVEASLPHHTIYRPARLPRRKLPILLWGNGACRDNGLGYARFLRQLASHDYRVGAVGHARREEPLRPPPPSSTAPVAPAGAAGAPGPGRGVDETQASQLVEGLDWAIAENARKGSPLRGRLDTKAVAVMGHSCGGLQAIAVAADPRVRTAMIWNSGVYNRGAASGRSGIAVTKDDLARIHGPIAYINGGPADIAFVNALDDFEKIDRVPALFAWLPVGHGGTFFTEANGGAYADVAVAWLDWQLKRDRRAGRMFAGTACGLCRDGRWTVRRKRLD